MGALAIKRVTVEHLTLRRHMLVVDNLRIEQGQLCAVVGPNLSGRTALLRALAGEFQHSALYRVELEASWSDIEHGPPAQFDPAADVVYLGPTPESLMSALTETVKDEIELHQECKWSRGLEPPGTDVAEAVRTLGLAELLERNPVELSGGQMAAVALTSALALRRPLVCVDGLLAQLDVQRRDAAYTLRASYAATGAIVIVAENALDWAPLFARHILLLDEGRLRQLGTSDEVLRGQAAFAVGCVPTAARYARELRPDASLRRLPLTADEFITWLREEYGLA